MFQVFGVNLRNKIRAKFPSQPSVRLSTKHSCRSQSILLQLHDSWWSWGANTMIFNCVICIYNIYIYNVCIILYHIIIYYIIYIILYYIILLYIYMYIYKINNFVWVMADFKLWIMDHLRLTWHGCQKTRVSAGLDCFDPWLIKALLKFRVGLLPTCAALCRASHSHHSPAFWRILENCWFCAVWAKF